MIPSTGKKSKSPSSAPAQILEKKHTTQKTLQKKSNSQDFFLKDTLFLALTFEKSRKLVSAHRQ
jgi:hypothetical protein